MESPLFSIITITYNAEEVLRPTLTSVRGQAFSDFEHIIIDGASRDNTLSVARKYGVEGIKIFSEPDRGLYDAMNKGIARATGRYLIFLNAGDSFAATNALERLAAAAKTNPDVIYGQTQLVDAERIVVGMRHLTAPTKLSADSFKHGMLVCHQAFVARREMVPQYDLSYRFSADYDWCIRCLKLSKSNVYVGDAPLISYLTDGLTDRNRNASLRERFHIMCIYYGTFPTILRHIGFALRHAKRKFLGLL
ncbi:MAG: glycosyltransferase family 2 protein [Muribaculaceae bacterium]